MVFRVLQPCHRKWESLEGDGVVRHCPECNHAVYDLGAFTEPQVRRLMASMPRLCGLGTPAPRRGVLAMMASFPLMGQTPIEAKPLKIVVMDAAGFEIPRARITLMEGTSIVGEFVTGEGPITIASRWRAGLALVVSAQGFRTQRIELTNPLQTELTVTLTVVDIDFGNPIGLTGVAYEIQMEPLAIEQSLKPKTSSQRFAKVLRWLKLR